MVLNNLGIAYIEEKNQPHLKEAIECFQQSAEGRVRRIGPTHPDTLHTLNSLAEAYLMSGDLPNAIATFKRVFDARDAMTDATFPDPILAMYNFAAVLKMDRQYIRAAGVLRKAGEKLAEGRFKHPETAMLLREMAYVGYYMINEKKYRDAEVLLRE